ncbi:MAG: cupin domain-containing protein [Ramlibacter sp.]
MDALSEVLKVVQFRGAVFFNASFTAPWTFPSPPGHAIASALAPGAEQLVLYHYVTEGECVVSVDGSEAVRLVAGDIVMFPHADAHLMLNPSSANAAPIDVAALLRERPRELRAGGGGEATRFICGYLTCDPHLCRPILTALPRVLSVSLRGGDGGWLDRSFQHAVEQAASPRPGSEGMLAKLSEVMMVETLRRYMEQLPPEQTGWLAGVRDRLVGRSLALMHERPAHPWTVEELAREVAASRSVLAERFTHFVGQSPMQYLAKWRMALAADLLRRSALSAARIAEEIGYETDTAFSRAFRREFGMPPATWRKQSA